MMYRLLIGILIGVLCFSAETISSAAQLSDAPANYYPEPWRKNTLFDERLQIEIQSDEFKPPTPSPKAVLILTAGIAIFGLVFVLFFMPRD